MKHCIWLTMLAVFTAASTGCTMMNAGRNAFVETTRMFRPNPHDEPIRPENEEDEWAFVGHEGRAGMDRERDPDRWWQKHFMSPQARNIERNLGID